MPSAIEMTNRQQVDAGITILDQDGQPFAELPTGVTTSFESSNSTVAPIEVHADNMNITVTSGQVGNAVITARVSGVGAAEISDTLSVAVKNSAANSVNFTVGTPTDEA